MSDIRILTLNCWGLKYVSHKRRARIQAIAAALAAHDDYDIIALQEVWVDEDFHELHAAISTHLPFVKRWHSGMLAGPGLAVFSRWVIDSAWLYRFPLNGRPSAFWRGDWYVGKSAGVCVIAHPSGRKLEIINAHLHAPYAKTGDAAYECHRASQAWDLAGIVSRGVSSGYSTFVTGDLNMRPNTVGLKLMSICGRLSDAWTDSHATNYTAMEIARLNEQEQIELAGVTSDSRLNTWRANYAINRAKRLDYIFYDRLSAVALESKVVFTKPVKNVGSVSDHFGFAASFELLPSLPGTPSVGSPSIGSTSHGFHSTGTLGFPSIGSHGFPDKPVNNELTVPCSSTPSVPPAEPLPPAEQQGRKRSHSTAQAAGQFSGHNSAIINEHEQVETRDELINLYDELLAIIAEYKPTTRSQSFWRIMHFYCSMLVIIALLVAVWWGAAHNRPYVAFIFILVSVALAITGTADGLIGFLFGRNERRALMEFEDQTQLALRNLTMYTN